MEAASDMKDLKKAGSDNSGNSAASLSEQNPLKGKLK